VFKEGKYYGLEKGTKVVCTKSGFIGYVGWVDEIYEKCPRGTIKCYFPAYEGGKYAEYYQADPAIEKWGLCVVPDTTDLKVVMSTKEALSYLRVPDDDFEEYNKAQIEILSQNE